MDGSVSYFVGNGMNKASSFPILALAQFAVIAVFEKG